MALMEVREALRTAMLEEMQRDESVILLGEEVGQYNGAYKVTKGLLDQFGPDRVIDTPITEYGFAGLGVGMALAGLRPIVEFMTFNFAMQAIDHIINSAAKTHYMSGGTITCPIVFRGPNGFAAGVAAQHSQCYASWYSHVPGLIVLAPYSAADCKGLMRAAIRSNSPVVFLEHELAYGESHDVADEVLRDDFAVEIGKASVVREGSDVTIVSYSYAVGLAKGALETLESKGVSVELIDLRSLRPLDIDTVLQSVKKTNRLVIVEGGWPFASVGSEIASLVSYKAFDYLDAPVVRVNAIDVPLPYAVNLEQAAIPSVQRVVDAVSEVMNYTI